MAITQRRMTLAEFLELPEQKPALEYLDGVVTQKVSPQFDHGIVQGEFTRLVNNVGHPRRMALAVPELRTTYAGASLVPDVAVYRWERVPRDARGRVIRDATMPPDIVLEVRSPSQTHREQMEKCAWYLTRGVAVALLADPDRETLVVNRPGVPPITLQGNDELDLSDVVPGLVLVVADLFAALTDPRPDS